MSPTFAAVLPEEFRSRIAAMSGQRIQLVIQKRLTATDVFKERFLIPASQVASPNFLTLEEQAQLNYSRHKPIVAVILDPSPNSCAVDLKRFNGTGPYAITSNWSLVMKRNREALVEGALVQLWSFRCASELCIAVVVADGGDEAAAEKEEILMRAGYMAYEYLRRNNMLG
ncbi:unnamed protein product [Linum trigynum]|uniref:Uncharacterized protein n=1 Tax=Linum trigynum TaxID=586398 RepID=A0AAV2G016_9ROSI